MRVNPVPAPAKQRLLVEFCADWPGWEPMEGGEYEPLAEPEEVAA